LTSARINKGKTLPHPFVSILIPTGNNEKDLMDCLNSVGTLDYSLEQIEIIIWDNNSRQERKEKIKDYLLSMTKEKALKVEFIENSDNYGVYTSRDELFKRVNPDADFVLSIDDDVILPSQLLKDTLTLFQRDTSTGIIGPRTVYDDAPSETAHGAGFVNWWLGKYATKDANETLECDYVIGCCMLINKKVLDEIGGFDRDYYTSHGEIDFCLRAKRKGFKILYYPSVSVRHRVAKGGTRTPERMYYVYRNKLFVIRKNAPLPQKWISLALYFLFWLPKSILNSISRNGRTDSQEIKTIFNAMMDGWLSRGGRRA
jgi:GT2 family glycosyltransferase